MKTVFSNAELPHIFAAQSQSHGRNANGSFYFQGATLYSYRDSFPIVRIQDGIALVSADSYSVTTSRHQSLARRAISHFEQLILPRLGDIVDILTKCDAATKERLALAYIAARMKEIDATRDSMTRLRAEWKKNAAQSDIARLESACDYVWQLLGKRSDWRNAAAPAIKKRDKADKKTRYARAFSDLAGFIDVSLPRVLAKSDNTLFELERSISHILRADMLGANRGNGFGSTATWTDAQKVMGKAWAQEYAALAAQLLIAVEPLQARVEPLRKAMAEKEAIDNAEKLAAWLAGENIRLPRMDTVYCRVVNGDTVQTSHGAQVPLADAMRVVKLAQSCADSGKAFRKDSFATGIYKGIAIDTCGNVTIGCHRIGFAQIRDALARFEWVAA